MGFDFMTTYCTAPATAGRQHRLISPFSPVIGSMMTLGADLAPEGERGAFLGVWRLIGDVGSSGGPLVVGAIADLVVLSTAALVMSAAGLLASAIFAFLVPETLSRRVSEVSPSPDGD